MRRHLCLLLIILECFAYSLYSDERSSICKEFSDSIWILWFADSLDTNVETSEMRNEYIFCRLESDHYADFVRFLYVHIDSINRKKIEKDLQSPINDNIDYKKCVNNVMNTNVDCSFKMWLANLICRVDSLPRTP